MKIRNSRKTWRENRYIFWIGQHGTTDCCCLILCKPQANHEINAQAIGNKVLALTIKGHIYEKSGKKIPINGYSFLILFYSKSEGHK